MDNIPKDGNENNSPPPVSGEIFNNQDSSYEATIRDLPQQNQQESYVGEEENINQPVPETGETSAPPPPFEENKTKKYVIIFLIAVIILGLIFIVFKFLTGRKPPVTDAKITLTYWGLWEDEEVYRSVIDQYQKDNPNITIKYEKQKTFQYRERLTEWIKTGKGPDIFRFHNTWVPMLQGQLAEVPKTIYSDDEYRNTFYPVVSENLGVGGSYYGIPLMIDGLMLYYNEDFLKSANVAVPKTWIDMQEAAQTLTVKENGKIITAGAALGTAENISHFSDILALMMIQNGTKIYPSFFSCLPTNNINCGIDTLAFYGRFAETPNNSWDATMDNSIISFSAGKVAMIIAPSWQAFTIAELSKNNGKSINFKTAQVPQLPCPPDQVSCPQTNWASYWVEGVASTSKQKEAAWNFLKYLSKKETMEKMYQEQVKIRKLFGEPYSRVDMGSMLADNLYIAPLIASAPSMKSFYLASDTKDGDTGLNSRLINYLKNAVNSLQGGGSPESALRTADSGFAQVFSDFKISQ